MHFRVGITDRDWYEALRRRGPDEVDFWRPSPRPPRIDVHRLFDDGYVTVDPDLRFVVGRRLREEFENGRAYYALHGQALRSLPERAGDRPHPDFVRWHNEEVFAG